MFEEESPYMPIRLMDLKLHNWKDDTLNKIENVLDSELKYIDERKGEKCKSIEFKQELGYPKQDARFLDLSIQGVCILDDNVKHTIDKDLITKAIIRRKDAVNSVISAIVFRVNNVQLYERNRNKLNLIIIPVSIGFVTFLFGLTFYLRQMRYKQKRLHIITELRKRRAMNFRKSLVTSHTDSPTSEKQRLLQLDASIVGNLSEILGSSKELTNEKSQIKSPYNQTNFNDHRSVNCSYQEKSSSLCKESQTLFPNVKTDTLFPMQPISKSNNVHADTYNTNKLDTSAGCSKCRDEPQRSDTIFIQEQNPRVVVRSIQADRNFSSFHRQDFEESAEEFITIPIQVESSEPHQRFALPTYHSDPYYRNLNL